MSRTLIVAMLLAITTNADAFFSRCQWYGHVSQTGCQGTATDVTLAVLPTVPATSDQSSYLDVPLSPGLPTYPDPPVSTVPEPGTCLLLGTGLGSLVMLRKRLG